MVLLLSKIYIQRGLTVADSQSIILGCYVIIFGAGEQEQPS